MQPNELVVEYSGFWPRFDPRNNIFVRALEEHYKVYEGDNPDIVFYSVFTKREPRRGGIRVFYTGEPKPPRMDMYDWAFSFEYDEILRSDRHLRLPLYVLSTNIREFRSDWANVLVKKNAGKTCSDGKQRKNFCAYISYHDGFVRCLLFDQLNKKMTITAPGRSRNNTLPIAGDNAEDSRTSRDWQEDKRHYLRNFRFAIVCENTSYPGYTSEKLVDAMIAGCIPIYWGNPEISRDFNTRSFVDVNAYEMEQTSKVPVWIRNRPGLYKHIWRYWVMPRAVQKAVQRVIEIDGNESLYRKMINEPWFNGNKPNIYFDYERFKARLMEIARSAISRRVREQS